MKNLPDVFLCHPAVYAVGKNYIITVPTKLNCYMWATVGGNDYYDDANGTLLHYRTVHKVTVPMSELDAAKEYTISFRLYPIEPESPDVESYTVKFRPVDPNAEKINVYQIADSHGYIAEAIAAGHYYDSIGETLDLLILNGDIISTSNKLDNFALVHKIAGEVTLGQVPVINARGNHDTRGTAAENYAEYMPSEDGNTYYTFRVGPIWGVCLDCGEDKPDDHPENRMSTVFAQFREEETEWLESVVNAENPEYLDEGIKYRMAVCHIPFARKCPPPFNIEQERYAYWCKLLGEKVKLNLMMCGHQHIFYVLTPGHELDALGQPCPAIVASRPEIIDGVIHFTGCAMTLSGDTAKAKYTDEKHIVKGEDTVDIVSHLK